MLRGEDFASRLALLRQLWQFSDQGGDMSIESDSSSAYAPIRQRGMMWWRYAQATAKEGHITSEGLISSVLPSMIEQNVALPYITNFHQVVKGQENADYQVMVHIGKMMMLRDWIGFRWLVNMNCVVARFSIFMTPW